MQSLSKSNSTLSGSGNELGVQMHEKILIVEDESIFALELKQRLKELGYFITGIAMNCEKAIELAGNNLPDVVLMDINIQGDVDGIDTAIAIKNRYNIPSIFLSALSDKSTMKRLSDSGFDEYLSKPFIENQLKEALRRMMGKINPGSIN